MPYLKLIKNDYMARNLLGGARILNVSNHNVAYNYNHDFS
jgi:hypothetical protein